MAFLDWEKAAESGIDASPKYAGLSFSEATPACTSGLCVVELTDLPVCITIPDILLFSLQGTRDTTGHRCISKRHNGYRSLPERLLPC